MWLRQEAEATKRELESAKQEAESAKKEAENTAKEADAKCRLVLLAGPVFIAFAG